MGKRGPPKGIRKMPGSGRKAGTPNKTKDTSRAERGRQAMRALVGAPVPPDVALPTTVVDRPSALDLVERIMWFRHDQGDHAGALTAASILMPYRFARLNATDITVRHTYGDRSDQELQQELRAIDAKLRAAQTINGHAIELETTVSPAVSR